MTRRTLSELAELCGARLEGDGSRIVVGPASLDEARSDQISFLGDQRYTDALGRTGAGALVVPEELEVSRSDVSLLRHPQPSRAFTRIIEAFAPPDSIVPIGVHESAVVAPTAVLAAGVRVGPLVVIGDQAQLADGVVVHARGVLGAGVHVGEKSILYPGVVLYDRVRIGRRCLIHAGAVLGADGFAFDATETGWERIPQHGTVEVGDEVEIGANTTIDRGRFGVTRIGRGVKIDNLVHVAHNCTLGEGAMLVAQVGLSGSTRIGKRAILAGQVGVTGHLEIGDGARVMAQSGVDKSLPAGGIYFGSPARPRASALRSQAMVSRLPKLHERLHALEARLNRLEGES